MKTKTWFVLAFLSVVAGLMPAIARAQFTNPRPILRAADEHLALLLSRAYDRLDKAADDARANASKTSDGQPLLGAIYQATGGCNCGNQLTDELWRVRKERLEEWRKRNPGSITASVSLATFPLRYGWFARGGGYANTVNKEGWQLLRERVEEARLALAALDAQAKADPGWFDAMLEIATSQGWPRERFDALLEQAVRKYPDYLPFYFAAAVYYAPRWYGSVEELRRVVEDATERTRPRMGQTLYARLNWALETEDMFKDGQTDWKRMKAGFERMVKDYPDPWNVNNFARFACEAGDWATVRRLATTIGDKPIAMAWYNDLKYYAECRDQAARVR